MLRSVAAVVLLVAGLMALSRAAIAESRLALVIGQSAYRSVVSLPNTVNDARMMGQLLSDAGFEVTSALDLSQTAMREAVADFTAKIDAKGPDTVALMFYAGHGLQVDGENFLIPVDLNPQREADVSMQAVRLNDVLNTLASVPSKMRIVMIDACRNNPFPEVSKTAGRGLALVDAKSGATDSFLTYSTSPGAEAEDGSGNNSPYAAALLEAARQPGLPIEDIFKRVRVAVNKATDGRQIPWESSSLTREFIFFPGQGAGSTAPRAAPQDSGAVSSSTRSVESWRKELQPQQPEAAYQAVVANNTTEAYQAFVDLFVQSSFGPRIRVLLDRRYEMLAWNKTVNINTAPAYQVFLSSYPNSDLAPTARKLEERTRNRVLPAATAVVSTADGAVTPAAASSLPAGSATPAAASPSPTNVSVAAPICPCTVVPPSSAKQKADRPPSKKQAEKPARRARQQVDEEEPIREIRPLLRDNRGYIGDGLIRGREGYVPVGPPNGRPRGGYGPGDGFRR